MQTVPEQCKYQWQRQKSVSLPRSLITHHKTQWRALTGYWPHTATLMYAMLSPGVDYTAGTWRQMHASYLTLSCWICWEVELLRERERENKSLVHCFHFMTFYLILELLWNPYYYLFVFITITKVKEENLNQQKTDSELEWQSALEKDRKLQSQRDTSNRRWGDIQEQIFKAGKKHEGKPDGA